MRFGKIMAWSDMQDMSYAFHSSEHHYSHRSPWIRAAILGGCDGITSVGSLLLALSSSSRHVIVLSGVSALVAGAFSMAVGELVSVYSQRDSEKADLQREIAEHAKGPDAQMAELQELTQIYIGRGLEAGLAEEVAAQMTAKDPIRAHARDELQIDIDDLSSPWQASVVSALSFAGGAAIPLLSSIFIDRYVVRAVVVTASSIFTLALLGSFGSYLGGVPIWKGCVRVILGGTVALGATYGVGRALE